MGVVYHARDVELGRDVAIKVMRPAFVASLSPRDAREAVARFLQEARAAAALSHPSITVVHRVGTVSGQPYFAMEWLDGWTVESLIATDGPVTIQEATRVVMNVLAALKAAHAAGIVHRDIKPANLIITREHRVKVTDFGIARVQGSQLAQTRTGLMIGTPQYAAPEQLAGMPIDGRADLYALGAVLYEMVTGRPPFVSESAYELVRMAQSLDPAPPSAYAEKISPAFDGFMARALAKTPQSRFANARQMAVALRPFLDDAPAAVAPLATAPTVRAVPSIRVEAQSVAELIVATVRTWPAQPLGRRTTDALMKRLLERPLHAAAFCGALIAPRLCLLVCDAIIYAAFDPVTGLHGDAVIEGLPAEIDATLHSVPREVSPEVVPLLASMLAPATPTLSGLDASFADLPMLAGRLEEEEFDGVAHFTRDDQLGFVLFKRGRRVLEVFTSGWGDGCDNRWEEWIRGSKARASVEPLRVVFPSITFRQQLADLELEVVRLASPDDNARVRRDAAAEARALELRPRDEEKSRLRRGDSTLHALAVSDPIFSLARWLLTDLPLQFDQFRRTSRWKGLIVPLSQVTDVRLHHRVATGAERFDAALFCDGRLSHVVERVAVGDRAAVARFLERAAETKAANHDLGGAILFAPSFTDDALEEYLGSLRRVARSSLRGVLESGLSHREGFMRSARGGYHVLLVEDAGTSPRPLVTE